MGVVGMPDATTAITIVAMGTSLPDTFASMASASKDDTADSSIVNVTGSNSVNVYLGIGIPWLAAALYWTNGPVDAWRLRYA
ncbi:Slc8a3, partial [Symbiodinium sp. CCMP2456]